MDGGGQRGQRGEEGKLFFFFLLFFFLNFEPHGKSESNARASCFCTGHSQGHTRLEDRGHISKGTFWVSGHLSSD